MKRDDAAEALRREILQKVRDYHAAAFAEEGAFVPGETPVPYAGRVFDADEMSNLVDSALDFWLTYGRYSRSFEQGLAAYLGVEHAYLVNSGSSANLLALAALTSDRLGERTIQRGDEVITVAAAFPTTVAPIVQLGAVPVFVDIELETGNVDVSQLDAALSERSKAVMLAHTLGNPFDLDAVQAFCRRHGLWLIEDNCDALGAEYLGRKTGTFGDIATSSFYPPHHMTTGEGGAVYTNDEELAAILLSMRDWGRDCWCPPGRDNTCGKRFGQQFGSLPFGYDHKYVYSELGFNLKASDMQAAVGVAQLAKLPEFVEARRRNHAFLHSALEPLADTLVLPRATKSAEPSWFGYLMTVRENARVSRADIVGALEERKIQTRMLFAGNIVRQPAFDRMRAAGEHYRAVGDLPNTDWAMEASFWVGVYPGMSEEMLTLIAETIASVVQA